MLIEDNPAAAFARGGEPPLLFYASDARSISTHCPSSGHMLHYSKKGFAMSLRFILVVSWAFPLMLLGWVMYSEIAVPTRPLDETNSKMRIRMCREHIDTAKSNPDDKAAKTAIEECTAAGYLTKNEVELALD